MDDLNLPLEGTSPPSAGQTALRAVVLVEGRSDQVALETLAARRGRQLAADAIAIVPMGGAHALPRYLEQLAPYRDVRIAGLCDAHEEPMFRRALERAGYGALPTRAELERHGFFVCEADLEDELIRALGPAAVEAVVAAQGELGSLHRFQRQPAQRSRPVEAQRRRFLGTHSGRKLTYARLLVEALDLGRVPDPLDRVLADVYD